MNPGIFYLYEYKNDKKLRNAGFLKLIQRRGSCTIQISARHLPVTRQDRLPVLAFYMENDYAVASPLGEIPCGVRAISARLDVPLASFPDQNPEKADGLFLRLPGDTLLAALLPGLSFDTRKITNERPADNSLPETAPDIQELTPQPTSDVQEAASQSTPDTQELTPQPTPDTQEATSQPAPDTQELTPQPTSDAQELSPQPAPDTQSLPVPSTPDSEEPDSQPLPEPLVPAPQPIPAPAGSVADTPTLVRAEWFSPAKMPAEIGATSHKTDDPISQIVPTHANSLDDAPSGENPHIGEVPTENSLEQNTENAPEEISPAIEPPTEDSCNKNTENAPEEISPAIEPPTEDSCNKNSENTPEETSPAIGSPAEDPCKPNNEDPSEEIPAHADCQDPCKEESCSKDAASGSVRKIERCDLAVLPRRFWILANNSFLLHGYHNYNHLLLVEEDGHYWLGVPGIYEPREAKAAEIFGFPQFTRSYNEQIPLSDEERNDQGDFGYWFRYIG